MRHLLVLLLIVVATCLTGCPKVAQVGPNLTAHIQAEMDFDARVLPYLELQYEMAKGTDTDMCVEVASLLLYARHWAAYNGQLELAATNPPLGEHPGEVPKVTDTPASLCAVEGSL